MVIFDQSYPFLASASYRSIILQGDPFSGLWLVENLANQKPWKENARFFPKSPVARNYHGWITMFSIVRILRFRVIGNFGESKTCSTNHISSWLKSILFGFLELLELDRMTNVSNLTARESSSWVMSHYPCEVIIEWLILVYDSLFHGIEIWEYHGQRTISLQKSNFDLGLAKI